MHFAGLILSATLLLQEGSSVATPPHARGWDEFPVFVWREKHAGKPLPRELAEPFGGVLLMRGEDSTWAREQGLSYLVWNVAGRDALHLDADEAWNARVEEWIRTHDEELLVRTPCLNDPQTVAGLHATLDETLARHGEHPGLGFVLGDEVSLTPNGDPFDLCRCRFCEAKWKEYARKNALPERAPLTDEARLALLEDDTSLLGAWLARRRFAADDFQGLLLRLRERVRSPSIRVGLLGHGGSSAFGGLDLARCAPWLDFVECYSVREAREELVSLDHAAHHDLPASTGPPLRPATLATVFVGEETPAGVAWKAWEHWLRGGTGLVLWSDAELEDHPEHLARLKEVVATIRALQEQGLRPSPEQSGGAIVTDPDSIAASFLREALIDGPTWPRRRNGHQIEHGLRERKVTTWLRLIEDCGALPAALPLSSVRAECAGFYGFLVLPEILVLAESDVLRLEAFVEQGGTLVVDGTLGWVDRRGKPWSESVLDRLRAQHAERVLEAPPSIAGYLESRLDPARATSARGFLRALHAAKPRRVETDAAFPPELGSEAGSFPWLVNRFAPPNRDGGLNLLMLPNLSTREDRARLHDLELTIPPEAGVLLISPRTGTTLRAGDAAIFLTKRFGQLLGR